jgi:hypothetical protein
MERKNAKYQRWLRTIIRKKREKRINASQASLQRTLHLAIRAITVGAMAMQDYISQI